MPKKDDLLEKLMRKAIPRNFTIKELDTLMGQCGCKKAPGGLARQFLITMRQQSGYFVLTAHILATNCIRTKSR